MLYSGIQMDINHRKCCQSSLHHDASGVVFFNGIVFEHLLVGVLPIPQKAQLFGKPGAIQMDWFRSVAELIRYYPSLSLALEESLSHP
jgi:hypothetical protein